MDTVTELAKWNKTMQYMEENFKYFFITENLGKEPNAVTLVSLHILL
jgi:hypothetical protein